MKQKFATDSVRLAISTPDGDFLARYTQKGLAALHFPAKTCPADASPSRAVPPQIRRWHSLATAALRRALAGREPGALPPLDASSGTPFQQRVWAALRKVGVGRTQSYGEVAQAIGTPGATRAVGAACGANPIPVFVPCHRVLAAKHKLGGFSAGLDWKRRLLAREGVTLADPRQEELLPNDDLNKPNPLKQTHELH